MLREKRNWKGGTPEQMLHTILTGVWAMVTLKQDEVLREEPESCPGKWSSQQRSWCQVVFLTAEDNQGGWSKVTRGKRKRRQRREK
jgi:hypothetical protein